MSTWRSRTTSDLFNKILTSMPPGKTGSLGETEIVTIVAFILQSNGAPGGKSGAQRHLRCAYRGRRHGTSRRAASFRRTRARAATRYRSARVPRPALRLTGDVKNYVPAADDMLQNPDPGDWLMARRKGRDGATARWPRSQPSNVRELRLAWVWAMNGEGGSNKQLHLVHNGIIYLANNDGQHRAGIDGRTGELIWENRVGPEAIVGQGRHA